MGRPTKTKTVKTCKVCSHPARLEIEALRVAGSKVEFLMEKFGLHKDSLYRHFKDHLGADRVAQFLADVDLKDLAEKAAAEDVSVLHSCALLRKTAMENVLALSAAGDRSGLNGAIRAATSVLEVSGRFSGELRDVATSITNNTYNTSVAFIGSPVLANLQRMLLDRLAPYPEALRAVLAGLEDLERPPPPERPEGRQRTSLMIEGHPIAA